MICPICGGATRVYDSRKSAKRVRRRRECKECGERFTTLEMAQREADALQQLADWWIEIIETIKVLDLLRKQENVDAE